MHCLLGWAVGWKSSSGKNWHKVMSDGKRTVGAVAGEEFVQNSTDKSCGQDEDGTRAGSSSLVRSDDGSNNSDGQEEGGSVTTAELVTSAELTNIRELATDEPSSVSGALRYCKRRILYPYLRLLGVMGLKPTLLSPESVDSGLCLTLLNRVYFILVVLLLLAGYVLQYLSCFRRDRGFLYREDVLTERSMYGEENISESICLGNPILIHLLPSLFHFSSFLYMVYLYRFCDDEQLQNLMERVFIQAAHSHSQFLSQKKLLRTLQWLVFSSFIWLIFSTACQLVQIWTAPSISFNFIVTNEIRGGLIGTLALSTTWQDAIQVTVIVSYCIHCILLSTYLELLYSRVQQHTLSLNECMKEIAEFEKLAKYLNSDLSPSLGPLLILNAATAISTMAYLALKATELRIVDFVCLLVVAALWFLLFIFPLIQAATLSSTCKKVREIGHFVRLRPFGYQDVPQEDLDSFLLFVSTLDMDVRVLKISVTTPKLASLFTIVMFATLLYGLFLSSIFQPSMSSSSSP